MEPEDFLEVLYARAYAMTGGHFKLVGMMSTDRDGKIVAQALKWEAIFKGHEYGCAIEGPIDCPPHELWHALHALLKNAVESLEGVSAALSN